MTRRNEFDAHRYLRKTRHKHAPQCRSTDRDYRWLWIGLVFVLMLVALGCTL